jgi:hypothetical protein
VRHEAAWDEWEVATLPQVSVPDLSPPSRASLVTAGCEAEGNAQETSEPSTRLRLGEDGKGERERILDEVSSFQPAGIGG